MNHVTMERDGRSVIPSLTFDKRVLGALKIYLEAMQKLNIAPPWAIMITLEGIAGAILGVGQRGDTYFDTRSPEPISDPILELPEVFIEDYGSWDDYQQALRPAFDSLWNAGGWPASRHFDSGGVWVGDSR